tara:strand:+ start:446 stop:1315 length:870 start_codon:yes stop_codon:yes gene_type:complete
LITLNKKLVNELDTPFHSYLLFSNLASHLLSQSKMFAMSLSFNSIDYIEHPDIKIIESENLNTLGVDDIRDVINKDNLSPIEGKYKVVIFPPVKSLTEEASNALLKTIEEPSSSSIFLILSSGKFWSHARDDSENMILSTIKSRCRTIFLETENEIKYDFSSSDFENFLNGNYYDLKLKKADFDKLLDSVKSLEQINSSDSKRIKDTQILINTTNDFISSLDENTTLNSTSLLVESLSYLASTLLIQEGLNKSYYEFASKIENAMQEISAGMRPQIVLSNLMLTTGTHG